jgi:predicted DCC family thiol-disulfide oxidoreductase YuxK
VADAMDTCHVTSYPRPAELTVFYDADCGLCTMTARILHAIDTRRRVRLTPLQRFASRDPGAPNRRQLLERLHARDVRGRWFAGADAILRIGAVIPLLVPLSLVGRLPGGRAAAEAGYALVADHRDAIGRWLGVDRCRINPDRIGG